MLYQSSDLVIYLPSNTAAPDGLWRPRPYQEDVWNYLENGGKRAMEIWHRRAGKDEFCMARAAVAAHERVGTYWHMLPEQAQARKAIWEAVDPHRGRRRIDLAFPPEIRARTRESEMAITFLNGSTWQVVGSDNFNSLVGTPPIGLVFSEWAISNPYAWAYLRPILKENGGWALFITTPRGRNHAYKMYKQAANSPDWHSGYVPATSTDVFSEQDLEDEKKEYINDYGERMGTALFEQEYLCSWEAAIPGAYFAAELNALDAAGRLTAVPYDASLPVVTSMDLGFNDENVTFFWQTHGAQVRMIDVMVHQGVGLDTIIADRDKKPYKIMQDIAPHDINVHDYGGGKQRIEVAKGLGVDFVIAPKVPVMDGIDAFRRLIPRLWVDREKCGEAFEILKAYRSQYDPKRNVLSKAPLHDYTSNYADACRYFAVTPEAIVDWGGDLDYSEVDR